MTISLLCSVGALLFVLLVLRRERLSLGLPVAYLASLEFIHLPGAFAHFIAPEFFSDERLIETGFTFATIGSISFVAGVLMARHWMRHFLRQPDSRTGIGETSRSAFPVFCLIVGWFALYALSPLHSIASVGAAVDKGGSIWMLGTLLGLRSAVARGDFPAMATWTTALFVFPTVMLLFAGFLSYGSEAMIIVLCVLTISARSYLRVVAGMAAGAFLGLTIFVNYFEHRDDIRSVVWSDASLADRLNVVANAAEDAHWLDLSDPRDISALDERLNQNLFVGLAAKRIEEGDVDYLYGESIWEGLIALVPRAIWPDKPVSAGSPKIVSEMTGLELSPTTSFGVGNVMEFQINYGTPGVVGGFLVLGFLISLLDRKAAAAERSGDFGRTIVFFLPAVALINPNGSMVELASGSAAALIAAYGWKWLWTQWGSGKKSARFDLRKLRS